MEHVIETIAEASASWFVNRRRGHLSCAAREQAYREAYDLVRASLVALVERMGRKIEFSNN
jgi:hypothetical protein